MSSIVAVAGGTGKLGRAIVDELVAAGSFKVIVLARKADDAQAKELGARVIAVNYGDADSIASVLESNGVDTVISTLDSQAGPDPELALIHASEKSNTTKRYIPSTWGISYTAEVAEKFPFFKPKYDILQKLKKGSLEYTAVVNGYFLDYFVAPHVKTYMPPMTPVIDIASNKAAIPGSGDVPVTFTYSFDIGRFVAKLLAADKWNAESYIIGDKVTWNQFLQIAEEAKGTKFDVAHDSLETLKSGKITELPAHQHLYAFFPKEVLQGLLASFGVMFAEGVFDLKPSRTLNDIFPDVKSRGVAELVNQAWKRD
ncbi:NAD(P)-binding protein [Corynespora cassiicola Philippines]|uniref:NAD(P)-binding protein n=1 Tax=Corynespora cassiicola Philippines TaxID=1448308 RepID=A0A2T2N805_CORCC|nr:NAD(P)-binding protein [Corynespora cassiicola Philippines]